MRMMVKVHLRNKCGILPLLMHAWVNLVRQIYYYYEPLHDLMTVKKYVANNNMNIGRYELLRKKLNSNVGYHSCICKTNEWTQHNIYNKFFQNPLILLAIIVIRLSQSLLLLIISWMKITFTYIFQIWIVVYNQHWDCVYVLFPHAQPQSNHFCL